MKTPSKQINLISKFVLILPLALVIACSPRTPSLMGVAKPTPIPTPVPTPTPVPPTPTPTPTPVPATPTPTPTPIPATPTPTPTPVPATPTPTPTPVPTPAMKTINDRIQESKEDAHKVDILFVIDNSNSMEAHQVNLRKNLGSFVRTFDASSNIDFHIGMVTTYDPKFVLPGKKFYWPNGKLHPLVDPATNKVLPGDAFVTRRPNFSNILGRTLNIGIQDYRLGGPQFEEIFTPISASMDDGVNPGFYRSDAHMAVIILTDAEESQYDATTGISVYDKMLAFKGGDASKISTFGVFGIQDPQHPTRYCNQDDDLKKSSPQNGDKIPKPYRLLDFIAKSNGPKYDAAKNPQVISICSEQYGQYLAKVGNQIRKFVGGNFKVDLKGEADVTQPFKVVIGGKEAPSGTAWQISPDHRSINIIDAQTYVDANGKANVDITYRPVQTK